MSHPPVDLKPRTLLRAYGLGHFPMADSDGVIRWYSADPRGVIPLDPKEFHIPNTLKATINQRRFQIRINTAFEVTMRACAQLRAEGTWINEELVRAYTRLHELGFAHSVETWQNDQLVGGLYGVSLGGAFFGVKHVPPRNRCLQGGAGSPRWASASARISTAGYPGFHQPSAPLWLPRNPRCGVFPTPPTGDPHFLQVRPLTAPQPANYG